MKNKAKHLSQKVMKRLRKPAIEQTYVEAVQGAVNITNETVAEHREEVLSGARKYIYPLRHSAHRVVLISVSLFVAGIISFFIFCSLALYKFKSDSTFLYRVTQVLPFPVAKAGSWYIAYENYLFELRHYVHYYKTQQQVDFKSESGKEQLADFRRRALNNVISNAFVKELAKQHKISVSNQALDDTTELLRSQNRLGSSNQVFEDVLKEFWGWSVNDFRRELRQQLLAQKVVATLDTVTQQRANEALQKLQGGADFASIAGQYSDDVTTKTMGGDYGFAISESDRNLPPQVIDALFRLQPGQTSGIINTGTGLEIVKLIKLEDNKVQAAHISFYFKPIEDYIKPLRDKSQPHLYVKP